MAEKVILLHAAATPAVGDEVRSRYAQALNPAQLEAATHLEGPLLVIAGAGSGKTRTLIYRVAYLIERGVSPDSILLLTFTRRAAHEMLRRAELLVGERGRKVAGGTFHSFANSVLRRYAAKAGLSPNFTILDRADMEDTINLVRSRMKLDTRERRFPRKDTLAALISMARNKSRPLKEEIAGDYPHLIPYEDEIADLAASYENYKSERGLLDYDDLLLRMAQTLAADETVRREISARYRFIMVDEYQDTNRIQADLVKLLAAVHRNVMVVGDDAQSIYSFRGADFRNIMDFPALLGETPIVKLEENYRSLQGILDLANEIIAQASEKYTKVLFTRRSGQARPLLVRAQDEHTQSRFVAQRVLELREEDVPLGEVAVLFRSGFHSFDLELELQRRDIPFVKRGGFKFVESAHVKDVLAHLRVILNPKDAISWLRVLKLVKRVGNRRAAELIEVMRSTAEPETILAEAGAQAGGRLGSGGQETSRLASMLGRLRTAGLRPAQMLGIVLEYYLPVMREAYPDDYPRRERDLEHFQGITERYRSLEAMVAEMALEPPVDAIGGSLSADSDEGCLTLSTIHSAKGLEWKAVFLIWAAEGRFPAPQSSRSAEIEEERRLMYVAVTRARDELYIIYPMHAFDRAMGYVAGAPSRFVENIGPEAMPRAVLEDEGVF